MKFSDFKVGDVYEAGPRPVDEKEIIEFATHYDPQPFHIDRERAAASRWGGIIGSGWLTCSIAMEMAVRRMLLDSDSVGSPGIEQLQWEKPVRPGDALRLRVTVIESRVSSSGKMGIIRWRWELFNQQDMRVLHLIATSFFDGPAAND